MPQKQELQDLNEVLTIVAAEANLGKDATEGLLNFVKAHFDERAYKLLVSSNNYRQINAQLEADKVQLQQANAALKQQLALLNQRLDMATRASESDTQQLRE